MEFKENPIDLEEGKNTQDEIYKEEIKQKISSMKKSKFRTTNFSLIEYFVKNDFKPYNQEELISLLLNDYNANPTKYILSNDKGIFKNEKSFLYSIKLSIVRNKSFMKIPGSDKLTLNLEKTVQYLKSMCNKYLNNSKDIVTPLKVFNRGNNRNNRVQTMTKKIKGKEDLFYNNSNMDFIQPMENNNRNNNTVQSTSKKVSKNAFHQLSEKISRQSKNEKENKEIIYISNSSSCSNSKANPSTHSNSNENIVKNDIDNELPEIFSQKLYSEIIISSFNNNSIEKISNSFEKFLSSVKSKKMNAEIEEELDLINLSLKEIINMKTKYDTLYEEIRKVQHDLTITFKVMSNLFKYIGIEINVECYSYEVYRRLRDLIFQYEEKYNGLMENIEKKLKELIDIEKELVFNRRSIQAHLINMKNKGFCDFNFSRLANSIEIDLKFNNNSVNDMLNKYLLEEENNIYSCITIIMNRFDEAKKKIIDSLNDIDKYVGNITIY